MTEEKVPHNDNYMFAVATLANPPRVSPVWSTAISPEVDSPDLLTESVFRHFTFWETPNIANKGDVMLL